jgi:hypothetical protein
MDVYLEVFERIDSHLLIQALAAHEAAHEPDGAWIAKVWTTAEPWLARTPAAEETLARLSQYLAPHRLKVAPLPVALADDVPVEAYTGFAVVERPSSQMDRLVLAAIVAHAQPSPLPAGVVRWGHTQRTSDGRLAFRLWSFDTVTTHAASAVTQIEAVWLSTNIDDMPGEFYGYLMERLLARGARDVWFEPVQMKKSRPGVTVHVLAYPEQEHDMLDIIFRETTTLGIRRLPLTTYVLTRQVVSVQTPWGPVRIKLGLWQGHVRSAQPEYEDCAHIARVQQLPLSDVYAAAQQAWTLQSTSSEPTP